MKSTLRYLLPFLLFAAGCGAGAVEDGASTSYDPLTSASFTVRVDGTELSSDAPLFIAAEKENQVFTGVFHVGSDVDATPLLSIDVAGAPDAIKAGATFACLRDDAAGNKRDTSVLLQLPTGKSYSTNVFPSPAPDCRIVIEAITDTTVSASFSGTTVEQESVEHPRVPFSGSFVATRRDAR